MAYFECMVGSAGGGATITVTYNSSFYNKTMTCSNGSKTYTKTTTSSGSTEFSVKDEGTWTITCNGVSRTVNVVLNYTTQMAVTLTVAVYGAAGATITYTDMVGSKSVTLDNSGAGSTSITFIPPLESITFADTNKAKNPSNLSQNYSKSIDITESTSSIYVMPDNSLYWWGWVSNLIESCSTANGWSDYAYRAPVYNTNNCYCQANSGNAFSGIGSKNKIAVSKLHFIGLRSNYSYSGYFGLMDTKKLASMRQSADPGTSLSHTQITNSGTSPCYVGVSANNNDPSRTITIVAMWIE